MKGENTEFLLFLHHGFTLFLDNYIHQTQPLSPSTAFTWHKLVDLIRKSAFLEPSSEQTFILICGYPVRRQEGPAWAVLAQ